MGRRRQAREFALQSLYLADTSRMSLEEAMLSVGAGFSLDEPTKEFARSLVLGTGKNIQRIDERIRTIAANWDLERMAAVDRSLLRLASYELLHCPDTPVGVAIDEALEIAKVYSSRESSRFLNGILDKIKEARGGD